ncbi:hypothetical protein [Kitasatospora sp. NPDC088548]|uniref:hypothetical protein n=1 Tax=Kitasatospora sp. NPDC088548 TaxID=3364075 RepID=UPI00381D5B2E
MSNQGAPAKQQQRSEDGWWDAVYQGPAGTLPDTPDAVSGEGSVDDWFETAAGLIGRQRTGEPAVPAADAAVAEVPAAPEPAEPPAAEEPAEEPAEAAPLSEVAPTGDEGPARDSIDDWFDTAAGVIGQQPAAEETHRFPAPSWAADARAEEPADAPVPAAEPEAVPEPEPVLQKPEPVPVAQKPEPEPASEPAPVLTKPEPEPAPAVRPPAPEAAAPAPALSAPRPTPRSPRPGAGPVVPHVGERPPTYGPEPTAVPETAPGTLAAVVPDTALEGAQYASATLRAVSVRGDSARHRGEPRRDTLLVTRFGDGPDGLLLAAVGSFDRSATESATAPGAEPGTGTATDAAPEAVATATAEACRQLAAAIGRSRSGLAADLRDGARDRLRYGLQRLATSAAAPLRALAPRAEGDDAPSPASLHCLLLSLDPAATYRAAFGVGPGGLFLLRSGHWIDAYAARLLHHPDGQPPLPDAPVPEPRPFRFRMVPATPGDILLLCSPGLARPIADEPAVAHFLAAHWAHPHPPGTVDFLRQVQVRAKGYADDRTAAAIWTE